MCRIYRKLCALYFCYWYGWYDIYLTVNLLGQESHINENKTYAAGVSQYAVYYLNGIDGYHQNYISYLPVFMINRFVLNNLIVSVALKARSSRIICH